MIILISPLQSRKRGQRWLQAIPFGSLPIMLRVRSACLGVTLTGLIPLEIPNDRKPIFINPGLMVYISLQKVSSIVYIKMAGADGMAFSLWRGPFDVAWIFTMYVDTHRRSSGPTSDHCDFYLEYLHLCSKLLIGFNIKLFSYNQESFIF